MQAIEAAPAQADETCAWIDAESKFSVRIDLSTPLVPPWTPPPKPLFTLEDLIGPEKDPIMHPRESDGRRAFKNKVSCLSLSRRRLVNGLQIIEVMGSMNEQWSSLREENPDLKAVSLQQHLQDTTACNDGLRQALLAVLREKYHKHGKRKAPVLEKLHMTPGMFDVRGRLNEAYVHLTRLVEEAIEEKMELGSPVDGDSLEQLLQLAVQYEDMGWISHAKRKHLDALSAHPNTQVTRKDATLLTCPANTVSLRPGKSMGRSVCGRGMSRPVNRASRKH